MSTLHLEIVTPKGAVLKTDVASVRLPGKLGELGVLPNHVPLLSTLRPGIVRLLRVGAKTEETLAIGAGFAEVGAEDKVLVLSETHAFKDDVDVEAARDELLEAEAALKAWSGPVTPEHEELVHKADWAQARLELATAAKQQ